MKRILVTDIFGLTPELETFAAKLSGPESELQIIDPYGGNNREFISEAQAYEAFSTEVGMRGYIRLLQEELSGIDSRATLLGFSAGAAAIWALADDDVMGKVSGALLFYGGQIRHYTQINPVLPVHCIFPATESHFCVDELMENLKTRANLRLHQAPFLHGFMNPLSAHFNQTAYDAYCTGLSAVPLNECFTRFTPPFMGGHDIDKP